MIMNALKKCAARVSLSLYQNIKMMSSQVVEKSVHHKPVMVNTVVQMLSPGDDKVFLDMTFGGGGHTRAMMTGNQCQVYCLDRDEEAYNMAVSLSREADFVGRVVPLWGRFTEADQCLQERGVTEAHFDGVLIDAGCSSMQMDSLTRGFSISCNAPLDMRMDGTRYPDTPTAADVVNNLDMDDLVRILKRYGEERYAVGIAEAIRDSRFMFGPILTTGQLVSIVETVVERRIRTDKLLRKTSVATKTFQAIRIFVNNELNELNAAVETAYRYLKVGGTLVALTFHSLEDRIVKHHMKSADPSIRRTGGVSHRLQAVNVTHSREDVEHVSRRRWQPVNKHVLVPSKDEVGQNPRARSARLRAAVKLS